MPLHPLGKLRPHLLLLPCLLLAAPLPLLAVPLRRRLPGFLPLLLLLPQLPVVVVVQREIARHPLVLQVSGPLQPPLLLLLHFLGPVPYPQPDFERGKGEGLSPEHPPRLRSSSGGRGAPSGDRVGGGVGVHLPLLSGVGDGELRPATGPVHSGGFAPHLLHHDVGIPHCRPRDRLPRLRRSPQRLAPVVNKLNKLPPHGTIPADVFLLSIIIFKPCPHPGQEKETC